MVQEAQVVVGKNLRLGLACQVVEGRPFEVEGGHQGVVVQILDLVLEELQNLFLQLGVEGVGIVLEAVAGEMTGLLVGVAAAWTCLPCLGSAAASPLLVAVEAQNRLQEDAVAHEEAVEQILVQGKEVGEQSQYHPPEVGEEQSLVQELVEEAQSLVQVEEAQSRVLEEVAGIQPSFVISKSN